MSGPHTFSFAEAPTLAVYVCRHVSKEGNPILQVVHDADGDWQFLCGGDHGEADMPDILCVEHVIARDRSLEELASLGCNYSATRGNVDSPWEIIDESEQLIRDNIDEHGWHIVIVSEDDEAPGFAYSIGMEKTLGHPEIVMFGLPGQLMGWVINEIGARLRNGEQLLPDHPIHDLLEATKCILRPVDTQHYREYLGYARWYYSGNAFRVWQCFWPGRQDHLFPWEEGSAQVVRDGQPDLTRPVPGAKR